MARQALHWSGGARSAAIGMIDWPGVRRFDTGLRRIIHHPPQASLASLAPK